MRWKTLVAAAALCGAAGTAGAVGSLADVTIVDRASERTLPLYRHEGRYYVAGKPGHEYEVRIRNRTGADILAVVSVDGVNAVSGETADWRQTGYVLRRYQSYDVRGWRKNLDRVAAFFFTDYRSAYATRTGRPANVGVIGVAVFRKKREPEAWIEQPAPQPESPFPGERDDGEDAAFSGAAPESATGAARSAGQASAPAGRAHGSGDAAKAERALRPSAAIGTGHGRRVSAQARYTSFERATAEPEEVIAIQYDTYANLAAMGVIRMPRMASPTPFPGSFVPDP
jgi:hypothetical protein